jgi:hypothetical protein
MHNQVAHFCDKTFFFMGTFYSNAYGDYYIIYSINWDLDLD